LQARIQSPRNNRLKGKHDLRRDDNGIDAHVRTSRMRAARLLRRSACVRRSPEDMSLSQPVILSHSSRPAHP
jgi:hypothetical protein